MQVIDVIKHSEWQPRLLEMIEQFTNNNDHTNAGNYANFHTRMHRYDALYIIVVENNILAMSGLFNGGIYPPHLIRGLDRTLYFNWESVKSGFTKKKQYATSIFWPEHKKRATELGYSGIFVSIQTGKKRRAAQEISRRLDTELLPDMYNTCPNHDVINNNETCWQNIMLHRIIPNCNFELPRLSLAQYNDLYEKDKS